MKTLRIIFLLSLFGSASISMLGLSVYFTSLPSSVQSGTSYYVSASAATSPQNCEMWIWKNSGSFAYVYGNNALGGYTTDTGAQTVEYFAEAIASGYGSAYGWVQITAPSNTNPIGYRDSSTSSVAQYGSMNGSGWAADNEQGAPVTRVDILIDSADVGDATLGGYRPDVATAYGRSDYTYSGWSFTYNVGALSVGNHTLAMRAVDNQGGTYTFGTTTFSVTAAAQSAPSIVLNSPSAQTINADVALTINSTATDVNSNITWHNLEIQRPDFTWNFWGGFADDSTYHGGPVGSPGNSTRSASFTFDIPGAWHVRAFALDSTGLYAYTNTVTITVNKRNQDVVAVTSPSVATNAQPYTATAAGGNGTGVLNWALGTGSTAPGAAINSSTGVVTTAGTGFVVIKVRRYGDAVYNDSAWSSDFKISVGLGSIDSDADGLPDEWEMRYFGTLTWGASSNPDGDAKTNIQEYLAGTNPAVLVENTAMPAGGYDLVLPTPVNFLYYGVKTSTFEIHQVNAP